MDYHKKKQNRETLETCSLTHESRGFSWWSLGSAFYVTVVTQRIGSGTGMTLAAHPGWSSNRDREKADYTC